MNLRDPEFLALLRATVSAPEDDAPAACLADWLRERGADQLADLAAALPAVWPVVMPAVAEAVFGTPVTTGTITTLSGIPNTADWLTGPAIAATETPQWEHDCAKCVFLGRYEQYDLYFADHGGLAPGYSPMPSTVIARHGSDGENYLSGIPAAGQVPALGEALRRALQRGLLTRTGG